MQDLSGPKIRTGRLAGGRPLQLAAGAELVIEVGDFVGEPGESRRLRRSSRRP
jgi:pyruvate kinase